MIEGAFRENPFVGFGCGGYRSFCGPELARIGPFDRVQVVAGQNNCGKSALIDYFIKVLGAINARGELRKEDNPFVQADAPLGFRDSNEQSQATISLCVSVDALDEKMRDRRGESFMRKTCPDSFGVLHIPRTEEGLPG